MMIQRFSVLFFVCVFLFVTRINGTHLRAATMSWKPHSAAMWNTIDYTVSEVVRLSQFSYNPSTFIGSTGWVFTAGWCYGDTSQLHTLSFTITAYNVQQDWVAGTASFSYTYPAKVANYTVYDYDSGRIITLLNPNGGNNFWNISSLVTVGLMVPNHNQNGTLVYASSPISNLLPIVPIVSNFTNKIPLIGVDPLGGNLNYSLAPPSMMGASNEVQPTGLTIDSQTGIITFPTGKLALGFWNTVIKISNGVTYSILDFVMDNEKYTTGCDHSCTNALTACSADTQCIGCSSTLVQKCIILNAPIFLTPPSPIQGDAVIFFVNQAGSVALSALSYFDSPKITPSNTPIGALWTPQVGSNPSNTTLNWTPPYTALGSYVITVGLIDSQGLSYSGQYSFIINVVFGVCNYGTPYGRGCSCLSSGFNSSSFCSQCLPGYYGPTCSPCGNCTNGVCADGISGSGVCICNPGWQGNDCSSLKSSPCSVSAPSTIITTTTTSSTGIVSPSTVYAYLSSNPLGTPLSVNLQYTQPTLLPMLDVFFLWDNSKSMYSTEQPIQYLMPNFITSLNAQISTNVVYGLGVFTDKPGEPTVTSNDYAFKLIQPLTPDTNQFKISLGSGLAPNQALGGSDTIDPRDCQLDAIYDAATSLSVGWRQGSFRVIVLITDSAYWEAATCPGYMDRNTLKAALIANNVIPVCFGVNQLAAYSNLTKFLGFGAAVSATTDNSWNTPTMTGMTQVMASSVSFAINDIYGLVKSIPASQSKISTGTAVNNVFTLSYPNPAPTPAITTISPITLQVMGYGTSTLTLRINQAPVVLPTSVSTPRNTPIIFVIGASDPDQNTLTVTFYTLPSSGTLYTDNTQSEIIHTNTAYSLPNIFGSPTAYYVPQGVYNGTVSFTYIVNDGCVNSVSTGTAYIIVTWVDLPPVCQNLNVAVLENRNVIIPLNGTAADYATNTLQSIVYSLPSTGGTLQNSAGNAVLLYSTLNFPTSYVNFVPTTYFVGSTSFQYEVKTPTLYSSVCTVTIQVTPVNQPPVVSAPSPVMCTRSLTCYVTLTAWDPDANDAETFSVVEFVARNGFFDGAINAFAGSGGGINLALTHSIPTVSLYATTVVSFLTPYNAAGNNYAYIKFIATDLAGAQSQPVEVDFSIVSDNLPQCSSYTVTLLEDSTGVSFVLNGSDIDVGDQGFLEPIITSLPNSGSLYVSSTMTPVQLNKAYLTYLNNFTFVPTPLFYGSSSFNFQIEDAVGGTSSSCTISLSVTHVNHPPTLSFTGSITLNENSQINITQIKVTDVDPGDTESVYVSALPTLGNLYQIGSTTPLSPSDLPILITDPSFRLLYVPALNGNGDNYASFSVYAQDNSGAQSQAVVGTINVLFVNQPPVVQNFTVNLLENNNATSLSSPITLIATDVDNTQNQLTMFITSLPSSSLATLSDASGNPISVGSSVAFPFVLYANLPQYQFGNTSFTYIANDGQAPSTTSATVTISVSFINTPPICLYTPLPLPNTNTITANRGGNTTITLTLWDPDQLQQGQFGFEITQVNQTAGILSYQGIAIDGATVISSGDSTTSFSVSQILTFTTSAIDDGPICNFTFSVTDGIATTSCQVDIDVATDSPPTAFDVDPQFVMESGPSNITILNNIFMNGSDPDTSDQGHLKAVIRSLPVNGSLYTSDTNTLISKPLTTVTGNNTVYYVPTYYTYGTDSFTFSMIDLLGVFSTNIETVTINVEWKNFPPIASFIGSVSTLENQMVTISGIYGVDPDQGKPLTAWIYQSPALGTLYQHRTTQVIDATSNPVQITDSQFRVDYIGALYGWGDNYAQFSFYMDDGNVYNSRSNIVSVPISVTFVNQAPTVSSFSQTVSQGSNPVNITLVANDVDTNSTLIYVTLTQLPNVSLIQVKNASNPLGPNLSLGQSISYPWIVTLIVSSTPFQFGSTTLQYEANDGYLSSNTATVSLTVTPTAFTPLASATSPITVSRSIASNITLGGISPQPPDSFTFIITSYQGDGAFTFGNQEPFPTDGQFTISSDVSSSDGTTFVTYTAPNNEPSDSFALITYIVQGSTGLNSSALSIQIVMSPDNAPISTPIPNIILDEDSQSNVFQLTGTDADFADQGSLQLIVSVLPSNGVIQSTDTNATITSSNSFVNVGSFVYIPNYLFYGEDSLMFKVQDILGTQSDPIQVNFTIQHVNHRPSALVQPAIGNENSDVTIYLSYSDLDNDNCTGYVSSIPSVGTLNQGDGTPFSSTPSPSSPVQITSWTLIYTPPLDQSGVLGSFSFFVVDNSGDTLTDTSTTVTTSINVLFVNQPPTSENQDVTTQQDTPITIIIGAQDIDSPLNSLVVKITTFPTNGQLSLPTGAAVTPSTPQLTNRTVIYLPPPGGNNNDLLTNGPYDTFSFIVLDNFLAPSVDTYTVSISVLPARPKPYLIPDPTSYTVINNVTLDLTVSENQNKTLQVVGWSEYDVFSIEVINSTQQGSIYQTTCNSEGCKYLLAQNGDILAPLVSFTFTYMPPSNQYGYHLDSFLFKLQDSNGESQTITIWINVNFVDRPPSVTPLYFTPLNLTSLNDTFTSSTSQPWSAFPVLVPVIGNMNQALLISWTVTDPDTSLNNLTSAIVSYPVKGEMYNVLKGVDGVTFTIGSLLVPSLVDGSIQVTRSDLWDVWRVLYIPNHNDWGIVYSSFALQATDNYQLTSSRVQGIIRIKSINQPPSVNTNQNQTSYVFNDVNQALITQFTVSDSDAGFIPILIKVWIERVDGEPFNNNENVSINYQVAKNQKPTCFWSINSTSLNCTDNIPKLNSYLSNIFINNLVYNVQYALYVFVNDLGDGADPSEKTNPAYYLTAQASVQVVVTQTSDEITFTTLKNNGAMTGIICGAAAAGILGAFAVYRVFKKTKPPMEHFFGDGDEAFTNPLYDDNKFTNPIYNPYEDQGLEKDLKGERIF